MPFLILLTRVAQRLGGAAWGALVAARLPFVLLLAWLDRRPTVRSVSPLRPETLGPKVAVFCHFDRAGRIRDDLQHYLSDLARCGFSVVFVSNSPRLEPAAVAFLHKYCAGVLTRRNVGFDFSAWQDALRAYGLPHPDTELLVLANDSVYGPIRPLWPALAGADFSRADIWALTDSWQVRYHLQSYFLMIGPRALRSPAWAAFWRTVRPLASKHWVIRRFEIGFSQAMLRQGFRLSAIWPYAGLLSAAADQPAAEAREPGDPLLAARRRQLRHIREAIARGLPLNPTNDLWRQLLGQGYPFLKREMLRENRAHVADLWDWRALIAEHSEIDPAIIVADLARSARNRAP